MIPTSTRLVRCATVVLALVAMVLATARAQGQLTCAPSAADLVRWSKDCLSVPNDRWPAIDDLHDSFLDSLRALPLYTPESLRAQGELEDAFIAAVAAMVSADEACVRSITLERREARARWYLANPYIGVRARIPNARDTLCPTLKTTDAAVIQMQQATVTALEHLVALAEGPTRRQLARATGPNEPFQKDERGVIVALRNAIDSLPPSITQEQRAAMLDRLVLAALSQHGDSEGERTEILLSNLRDVTPEERAKLMEFAATLPARRRAARAQLLQLLLREDSDAGEVRAHQKAGIEGEISKEEFEAVVPERLRRRARDYIFNWESLGGIREGAATLLTDEGLVAIEPYFPSDKQQARMTLGKIKLPSLEADSMFAELRALVEPPALSAAASAYVHEIVRPWNESEVPALRAQWDLTRAAIDAAFHSGPLQTDRDRNDLNSLTAQLRLLTLLVAAEQRVQPVLADLDARLGDAQAISWLWHLARTTGALDDRIAEFSSWHHPVLPVAATAVRTIGATSAPNSDARAEAIRACAEFSRRQFDALVRVARAQLLSETRQSAERLFQGDSSDSAQTPTNDVRPEWTPMSRGGTMSDSPGVDENWETAWVEWLAQNESCRQALISRLPKEYADKILERWALECFPILRTVADWSVLDSSPAERPLQVFARRGRRHLRALSDAAFAPRVRNTAAGTGASAPNPALTIHKLLECIEEDARNSRARAQRDASGVERGVADPRR